MPLFLVPTTSKEEFESGKDLIGFVFSVKCALEGCISYLLPGDKWSVSGLKQHTFIPLWLL